MGLFPLIKDKYKIISIVGMAKNAGKTVTLNHLIETIEVPIGLTSIGRDGERQDIVTKTDKPMVYVNRGTYVATAEILFNLSEVKMEIIEVTNHDTAMGKVIIGRTLNDGFVQIGGPATNSAIRDVSEKMIDYGANYVFVDGALDRTSSASPAITDACILSTGAVLSRDMNKTVARTLHQVALFELGEMKEPGLEAIWAMSQREKTLTLVNADQASEPLSDIKTALNTGRRIGVKLTEKTRYIFFPGALVFQTVFDIVQTTTHYKHTTFVVGDATKIFIEPKDWQYLMRIGVQIKVKTAIRLIALTINPYAPSGYFYDSELFVNAFKNELNTLPVVDVMEEG